MESVIAVLIQLVHILLFLCSSKFKAVLMPKKLLTTLFSVSTNSRQGFVNLQINLCVSETPFCVQLSCRGRISLAVEDFGIVFFFFLTGSAPVQANFGVFGS